jgi:hypothetical protein
MQAEMNMMPWDGSGPIDPLNLTTDYFIRSFGVNTGLSAEEISAMVRDAYHYNGVPDTGYAGPQVLGATNDQTGGTGGGTGRTSSQIAELNTQHKENLRQIEQAYQSGLLDYNEKVAALEDSRNSLINQKDQGMESNSAYFSNVSPDAFQSQQGNYNQKDLDAYTQGEKTLENNQKSIDYSKQVNDQNYQAQLAGENTFNAGTGDYSGAYRFSAPTIQAPTINAVTANPYSQAAKLGVPSWAPNYGGLSTMQAKKKEEDSISRYLG